MSEKLKEPFYKKWWFFVIIIIVLVIINGAIRGPQSKTANAPEPAKTAQPSESPPAQKTTEVTLEDKVKGAITEAVNEKTNMDKVRLVKLEINDHAGTKKESDKIALITLNADENLSSNLTKGGILMDSSDLFKSLFENSEIEEVVLFWQLTLVDTYGNEKDDTVLKVALTKEIAGKINWDNFDRNNYSKVASDYWEHPALKQ